MTVPCDSEWIEAFAKAQAEFPTIPKTKTATIPTKTGGSYSYTYADLGDIIDAVRPILDENGLFFAQSAVTQDGKVGVETRIYHTAGHVENFGPLYLPAGNDARAAGSAVTYARRYSLTAALGITADEDADGAGAEAPLDVHTGREMPLDAHNRTWAAVRDALGVEEGTTYFKAGLETYGLIQSEDRLSEEQADELIAKLP